MLALPRMRRLSRVLPRTHEVDTQPAEALTERIGLAEPDRL